MSEARGEPAAYDSAQAKRLVDTKCAECHETTEVEKEPPRSEADARALVARMVEEGMTATEDEVAQLARYLTDRYAQPQP